MGRRLRNSVVGFGITAVIAQLAFWTATRTPPPEVPLPDLGPIEHRGEHARLGQQELERRPAAWFFVHRGDPVEMGVAHARLGEFITQRVEDQMFLDFQTRVPGAVGLLLPPVLLWQYRHMPGAVERPLQHELWGFAGTYGDRHGFPLSSYQRGYFYHALHDITQELVGNPWVDPSVAGACTAFGAAGPGTVDGHTIVGRNFDFEVFPIFDEEKVVHLFAREGAIPVLSVSWMAMMGVVTGLNAHGVWISINAARSEGRNRRGPPVALAVRAILEQAKTADEAEAAVRAFTPLVADLFLVGDAGGVRVVERAISEVAVRHPVAGRLSLSNHFRTPELAGDPQDTALKQWSTTNDRGARVEELVFEQPLSVERAQVILRDRLGPGGAPLALGDRRAIDALIATHSVIADLHDRVLWVSAAPATQGIYEPFDLLAELDRLGIDSAPYRATLLPGTRPWEALSTAPKPQALPAGDLPGTDAWARLLRYRALITDAELYLEHGQHPQAIDVLGRARATQPLAPEVDALLGLTLVELGRVAEGREALDRYLGQKPSPGPLLGKVRRVSEGLGAE